MATSRVSLIGRTNGITRTIRMIRPIRTMPGG